MTTISMRPVRRPRPMTAALCAAALGIGLLACDTTVSAPDIITPNNLATKDALPTIRAAAIGAFALAYGGSGADGSSGIEGAIMYSGLLADEFINSETFPTRIEVDRRSIQVTNSDVSIWFRNLQQARRANEQAAASYRSLSPDTTLETGFPEVLSLAGFTYVMMAENWCNGVPISTANPDGSLSFGQPLTRQNLLDSAAARFNQAIAAANAFKPTVSAATKAAMINLASVGLARTMLDSTSTAAGIQAAAAVVAAVPTSFVYNETHSLNSTRENNGVYVAMAAAKRYSVADTEGFGGGTCAHGCLNFRSARTTDDRVPSSQTGRGFDNSTPQWNQLRFLTQAASIPLATGAEARLIEAEARLAAADTVGFLAKLNGLRAAPPSYFFAAGNTDTVLTPLAPVGFTSSQYVDLNFHERAFWMWNTGHRLGDLRRMARAPYNDPVSTLFPSGQYFKGGTYGTDVNFPVPFDETNNPNFTQCLDRNP